MILKTAHESFDSLAVTCVLVILFTPEWNILTIENKRGIDIPGGHVEPDDINFEATARRELWEEAQTYPADLKICGSLECYHSDKTENPYSYMVIMTGFIEKLEQFTPSAEIYSRSVVTVEDFLSVYKAADPELMRAMIHQARQTL
jgi:8-oxo-dGTP diphosphatase